MDMKVATKKTDNYWLRVIIMLCMGWVTIWIYRSSLTPLFAEIQETVGVNSNTQMGMISSFYFAGSTFMQIPAGMLVDRFGKKKILIPGFIIFGLAAIVISRTTSLQIIYAASVFAGLGCGCYYGAAYSLSAESIPEKRKSVATAIINNGSAVGMGLGMILSSLLVKKMGLPWQTMMYFCAALIIVMLLLFTFGVKNVQPPKPEIKPEKEQAEVQESQTKEKAGLFSLKMLVCYLVYFGTCYGYYMVVTWLPTFLQEERGFQGVAIGFSSALVAFAAIPGALIFSRISDKYRHKKILIILILEIGAALMLFLTVIAPTSSILLIALILYGLLGKLAVEPILISYISDQANKKILGTTLGVSNFFGLSASIFAPTITGVISDASGTKVMGFYISIIIMLFSAVLFYVVSFYCSKKEELPSSDRANSIN